MKIHITNPFRPGAGHAPPYLAGRDAEKEEFKKLLTQETILSNLILTGLRGVGKTVLLEELKPIAVREKWLWVGTDLSEAASISEQNMVQRLIADLTIVTSSLTLASSDHPSEHSALSGASEGCLTYDGLFARYESQPGLASDKLKAVLEFVWSLLQNSNVRGIVFAYDEAQTISDHPKEGQFPLSLILDVFQSIQRKQIPFMLVMVGLPTLFPKLVEARTYSERMFDVQNLGRLGATDSKEAITRPINIAKCPVQFAPETVDLITKVSGGYPYFIQFTCKEVFDIFVQQMQLDGKITPVPIDGILKKLDKDFFAGRWARATDRQRQLLSIISRLPNCNDEFSVQEIVYGSEVTERSFSASHVSQMLVALSDSGLIYKNRHGRYAFAVPLLGQFIQRQEAEERQATRMRV